MQRTARHSLARRLTRPKLKRPAAARLAVEPLGERVVPATFTVTTGDDAGPGSLRQAILDSNATPGPDDIAFGIGGGGVQTVRPTALLPAVTDPVVIDGTTQPGYAGTPVVVVSGGGFNGGAAGYGLWLTAGNSTVRGLVVNGFAGAGIKVEGGGNNVIAGNYLGTDPAGTAAVPADPNTSNVGLLIRSADNVVGGATAADRNLISGHNSWGVHLSGPAATGNRVRGNYIGTDATGTARLGNDGGVVLDGGAGADVIGGTDPGAGNLIAGNLMVGVYLIGGAGTRVEGNRIGTDVTGAVGMGNFFGVYVLGGVGHRIGGADPGAGNVISGNVGPNDAFGYGVIITDDQVVPARDHVVQGNYVGVNAAGTAALPNSNDGVRVDFNAANVTIGGPTPGAGNVVSGNGGTGIHVIGSGNVIQGNYVGTDVTGTAALPNGSSGVIVDGTRNTVGGTAPGAGNLLSGNVDYGLGLSGTFHVVQGNRIGTDAAGTAALPNDFGGVGLEVGAATLIGGTAAGAGNLISGNGRYGIRVNAGGGYTVQGNRIGTDVTGTRPLGNGEFGVSVESSGGNLIGGPAPGAGNVIAATATGLSINAEQNTVQGNWIGTDVTGAVRLGNGVGVFLTFRDKVIGGTGPGEGNTIAYNTGAGVVVDAADSGTGNRIRGNSIHSNGGLGIDLGGDGVTPNDPGDADDGPNGLQNFPVLSRAPDGAFTRVCGTLNSTPNTTFAVDFYASAAADPSGFEEGARYLGSAEVTTDAAGNASFQATLGATPREAVTATATDPTGSTSEFSAAVVAYQGVGIDVRPNDPANRVNLNSNGVLAVAVLTTPAFDAATVDTSDLAGLRFGDATGTARVAPVRAALEDVDGDGDLDLLLFFSVRQIRESGALTVTTTRAELTGFTTDGTPFRGVDLVSVVRGPSAGP
jgi:titin